MLKRLAKNIRLLRREKGMSQAQLASMIGVNKSYLSRLEDRQGNPTLHTLEKLGRALNVDLVTLLK